MTSKTSEFGGTERAPNPRRVLVLGGTGTIGRAAVRALVRRGHEVVAFIRPWTGTGRDRRLDADGPRLEGAMVRFGDVTDPASLERDGFCGERFDAVMSCLASRTGAPKDAWAIDHQAHLHALAAAKAHGVAQFVLLSAICVQKPKLAYQHAKLAFETELQASGLTYSIVRATAYFKSLAGQVDRVKQGKPFLVFGDGILTACKPISDGDLGDFLALCLEDPQLHNRILPIGGPGAAITPKAQGEYLFAALGREPKFSRVPVALLDVIIWVLGTLGHVIPPLKDKAEFARIGRYYATESMLVLDPVTGAYDAAATPSFGDETLFQYYDRLLKGEATAERGDHAVF